MDKRWQMVLDCLGAEHPPFSRGTLFHFRLRLIVHNLDKTLLDRTVALAEQTGGFGARQLRAALDSTPLFGAGRVEDTLQTVPSLPLLWWGVRATLPCKSQPSEKPRGETEKAAPRE